MLKWAGPIYKSDITVKKLVPIVIAAAIWGGAWQGKTVRFQCDNTAVVSIVNHGTSKNKEAMHLARCLAFVAGKFDVHMEAVYIKGVNNLLADSLSWNNLPLFQSLYPQGSDTATPIPEPLLDMLILFRPDWTSKSWTKLRSSTFRVA